MNIRTITYFCDPGFPVSLERLAIAGETIVELKQALAEAGYEVQSTRFAAPPFAAVLGPHVEKAIEYARALEDACFVHQIDCATIGPARPIDAPDYFEIIPDVIGATQNIFASAVIAEGASGVSLPAIRLTAALIRRCAALSPDGLGNLRFAALANVPPGVPFLPAAYHAGGPPLIAVGAEAAEVAVQVCLDATSLADARARLVYALEADPQKITEALKRPVTRLGLAFSGIDFSYAVYPEPARSIGAALERLSGARVGEHGTLAAAAFLTETLERAQIKRAGFSGLFLPIFEDAVLAERAAQGQLTITDLLLYATVCGTGLDTVPLPGDTSPEALAAILLDVGALAVRLNKPLTAGLMPIPDKQAGDPVAPGFEYFAPSRVMAPRASGLGGLLGAAERLELSPRPQ